MELQRSGQLLTVVCVEHFPLLLVAGAGVLFQAHARTEPF